MAHPRHKRNPNNIRYYRRRAKMKLYELAHFVGTVSPSNVAKWEKGLTNPTLDSLLKIAAALKVPPEVLYLDRLKQIQALISKRRSIPITKPL